MEKVPPVPGRLKARGYNYNTSVFFQKGKPTGSLGFAVVNADLPEKKVCLGVYIPKHTFFSGVHTTVDQNIKLDF